MGMISVLGSGDRVADIFITCRIFNIYIYMHTHKQT